MYKFIVIFVILLLSLNPSVISMQYNYGSSKPCPPGQVKVYYGVTGAMRGSQNPRDEPYYGRPNYCKPCRGQRLCDQKENKKSK